MSYLKNKSNRRKTKYDQILLKEYGIIGTDSTTEVLVICNGGLCNGITYEIVCVTFEKFGDLENIIMVPGKSHCFVKFKEKNSAVKAFNDVNEKIIWPEIKGPIYLKFVQSIPMSLSKSEITFKKPDGLILIEDFITQEEEEMILNIIGFNKNDNSAELKHRKVKHFGYEFKYSSNNVDLHEPIDNIPNELNFLWDKLQEYSDKKGYNIYFVPDQLTVNCYEPGQGIPPHVDTHSPFENVIASLSLQSTVVMEFTNHFGNSYNVILPRRSLCLMTGESRYDWTHGITPRKSDLIPNSAGYITVQKRETRTSLTFRKTREGDCTCNYPMFCDSKLKNKIIEGTISVMRNINLNKNLVYELEGNYVHEVYEKIALHFSETRHKPWPNVLKFVQSFDPGSILIDVGCGNGKYFSKQSERFELGCDYSNNLMKVCKEQGFECFSCSCLHIPLRDNVADGCICIAVIHHLTTEERRRSAVREIIRVLRSHGKALIYVWAKNQEKNSQKSNYLKQYNKKEKSKENCELKMISLPNMSEELVLPVHTNRTSFDYNDLLVPWKLKVKGSDPEICNDKAPVYLRFYHVYEDDELKKMCENFDDVDIIDYYYDQGNWCIVLKKK